MRRRQPMFILSLVYMLLCIGRACCAFGAHANPYSEQSVTTLNAVPPHDDSQQTANWAARMNVADSQSLDAVVREIKNALLTGVYVGKQHSLEWRPNYNIHGCSNLVPGLTRALGSKDTDIVGDAAYCLAMVGTPSALRAVPRMVALYPAPKRAVTQQDVNREDALAEVGVSLWTLYSGPVATGDAVESLLFSPEPAVRLGAINFLTQPGLTRVCGILYPPGIDQWNAQPFMNPAQEPYANQVPSLARVAEMDSNAEIRLAALNGLARLSYGPRLDYGPGMNPWDLALPGLASIVTNGNRTVPERQAAAFLVVRVPADPMPIVPQALQAIPDPDPTIRSYALLILEHCTFVDPERLQAKMLSGLSSPDVAHRRQAAEQLRLAASALWGYSPALGHIGPEQDELTQKVSMEQVNDSRLFFSYGRIDRPSEKDRRSRLAAALKDAVNDRDHTVRVSTALALKRIGEDTDWSLWDGALWTSTECDVPPVKDALEAAASITNNTDPVIAKQLRSVVEQLTGRH